MFRTLLFKISLFTVAGGGVQWLGPWLQRHRWIRIGRLHNRLWVSHARITLPWKYGVGRGVFESLQCRAAKRTASALCKTVDSTLTSSTASFPSATRAAFSRPSSASTPKIVSSVEKPSYPLPPRELCVLTLNLTQWLTLVTHTVFLKPLH